MLLIFSSVLTPLSHTALVQNAFSPIASLRTLKLLHKVMSVCGLVPLSQTSQGVPGIWDGCFPLPCREVRFSSEAQRAPQGFFELRSWETSTFLA